MIVSHYFERVRFLKRMPPFLSALVLLAAVFLPVLMSRTFGSAQTAQNACGAATSPVDIYGRFDGRFSPSQQVGLYVFQESTTGDQYLQSLAQSAGAISTPKSANLQQTFAAISQQMTAQQQLQSQLPSLYSTMYGVTPNQKNGTYSCGGLPPGRYTLLALVQTKPPAASTAAPGAYPTPVPGTIQPSSAMGYIVNNGTPVPVSTSISAIGNTIQAARVFYYSWIVITPKDAEPLPQPTPAKGATPSPPKYKPLLVSHVFKPVTQFPAGYFGR